MKLTPAKLAHRWSVGLAAVAVGLALVAVQAPAAQAEPISIADATVPGFETWSAAAGSVTLTGASRVVVDHASAFALATAFAENPWNSTKTALETAQLFARDLAEVTGLSLAVGVGVPQAGDIGLTLQTDTLTKADAYKL
jgi:hexosaminidase